MGKRRRQKIFDPGRQKMREEGYLLDRNLAKEGRDKNALKEAEERELKATRVRIPCECGPPRRDRGSIDNDNLSPAYFPPPVCISTGDVATIGFRLLFHSTHLECIQSHINCLSFLAKIRTIWNPLIPLQTTENCLFDQASVLYRRI